MRNQFNLPGSMFVVFTGSGNAGKTHQVKNLIRTRMPDGSPAVAPTLYLLADTSSEGTAADLLADPSVLVWSAPDLMSANIALRECFPHDKPPLTLRAARRAYAAINPAAKPAGPSPFDDVPLRSIAVETLSTMYQGEKTAIREQSRDESGGGRTLKKTALHLDEKRIAGLAFSAAIDLPDRLNSIAMMNRGMLIVVSCHTQPLRVAHTIGEGAKAEIREVIGGEVLDYGYVPAVSPNLEVSAGSKIGENLRNKATAMIHLFTRATDYTRMDPALINDESTDGILYGAITKRGQFPKLGPVSWVKRQAGDGWLQLWSAAPPMWLSSVAWRDAEGNDRHEQFAEAVRSLPSGARYTGGPDFGLLLELCLKEHVTK